MFTFKTGTVPFIPPGDLTSRGNNEPLLVTFVMVLVAILVIVGLVALLMWAVLRRKWCFSNGSDLPKVSHNKSHGTSVIESSAPPLPPGIPFGSFQRQRSSSRKYSAKSRLSSALTEQYSQADIVYDPEWEVSYESLQFTSLLGEGAFGRVMKGISDGLPFSRDPTVVAVKMLKGRHFVSILKNFIQYRFNFIFTGQTQKTM